jgi:hypothetical protein
MVCGLLRFPFSNVLFYNTSDSGLRDLFCNEHSDADPFSQQDRTREDILCIQADALKQRTAEPVAGGSLHSLSAFLRARSGEDPLGIVSGDTHKTVDMRWVDQVGEEPSMSSHSFGIS